MWRLAIASASVSFLLALPTFASAALFNPPLGTTLFNLVIQRLCEVQQARGNHIILVDPARCLPPPPPPATITIVKMVVNDNGGTATSSAFTIHLHQMVGESMVDVPGSPQSGSAEGTTYSNLAAGLYHVAETGGPSGYAVSFSGACDVNGNVTLAAGEDKTCTVTNDDQSGRLIVDKMTEPSGSSAVFSVTATGTGSIAGGGAGTTTDAISKEYMVSAGTYSVTEAALAGWIEASNTCVDVVVGVGETKTCTITNHRLPKLTVTKFVVNDNGGTATTTDFTLMIDGATTTSGVQNIVATGTRMVSEGAHGGYTATIGGDCNADGTITLAIGDIKTCTVTNDDIAPPPATGRLVVDKITYPSGDTQVFSITATGTGTIIGNATGTITEATNKEYEVSDGTYSVVETMPDGWAQVGNACASVVVQAGETGICTITNVKLGTITIVKVVVNDNGGTATSSDFTVHLHQAPSMVDVPGSPQPGSASGTVYSNLATSTYHVAENATTTYTTSFSGDCNSDGTVELAAGEDKTCTVTNDDNPPPQQVIGHIVISEVHYDVASTTVSGNDSSYEWVELYNGSSTAINLQGWFIADALGMDEITDNVTIQAGGLAVVVASTTPSGIPGGVPVIVLNSSIGFNGFTNDGDGAEIHNASHVVIDSVGYGDNTTISPNVSIPSSHDGHSLMRTQLTSDTDTAADWADTATPTPGS
ncbi:lamin tail domain-containing protein [Candidatus Kaiserbacteria bacterium]|nr:lamin tail domain-containing protein [Candidatus Kaiserbacteria bacterium]